jgi:hypothetical protein
MAVTEDASTPAVATSAGGFTGTSINTSSAYGSAAFTPPSGSVLTVMCLVNWATKNTGYPAFTVSDSAGGTWTAGPVISSSGSYSKIQFFTRPCVTSPGSITVTFSRGTDTSAAMMMLAVRVNAGASTASPQGASKTDVPGSGNQASDTITPTAIGSLIYTIADWASNAAPTALSGTNNIRNTTDTTDGGVLNAGVSNSVGSLAAQTLGWIIGGGGTSWVCASLEILPSGGSSPFVSDLAAAREALTASVAAPVAEAAGAAETFSVVISGPTTNVSDIAAAGEDLSIAIQQPVTARDAAGAVDGLTVVIGGAPAPTPGTAIKLANPAFIKSGMPRMHVQNLLTGQWVHRDVQGVTQPSITWALNAADAFSCVLSPPRADMMDASGNAIITEWRDAIYLEEYDQIRFGGICTQSSMSGGQWTLTAMGFQGFANGAPYEGDDYVVTKTDALDVVRYMWNWLQRQPGSNIGLELGTTKAGFLLGAQVEAGVTMTTAADAKAGQGYIWVGNAQALNRNEQITINGIPYTTTNVVHDKNNVATGQVYITPVLGEAHKQGEPVVQQSPTYATLARDAAAGSSTVWFGTSAPFAADENITINGDAYTINQVLTDTNGHPTGQVSLKSNTRRAYAKGVPIWQVRTITPFELHWYNSTDIGSEMGSIRDEAIFDWREVHTWTNAAKAAVRHQLVFGVPRIGGRLNVRFAEGENIISGVTVTRDGTKYANNIIGLGAGSGTAQIRQTASDLNTGRLRRTYIYTDQTANTNPRMISKANKILTAMKNIDTVTQIVVINHPNAPFGSFAPGDDIPVQLSQGWRNTTIWSRITQMTQDPTTNLMTLTLARSDSFTYIPDTGMAGSL